MHVWFPLTISSHRKRSWDTVIVDSSGREVVDDLHITNHREARETYIRPIEPAVPPGGHSSEGGIASRLGNESRVVAKTRSPRM